jgi:hypothetical protein
MQIYKSINIATRHDLETDHQYFKKAIISLSNLLHYIYEGLILCIKRRMVDLILWEHNHRYSNEGHKQFISNRVADCIKMKLYITYINNTMLHEGGIRVQIFNEFPDYSNEEAIDNMIKGSANIIQVQQELLRTVYTIFGNQIDSVFSNPDEYYICHNWWTYQHNREYLDNIITRHFVRPDPRQPPQP